MTKKPTVTDLQKEIEELKARLAAVETAVPVFGGMVEEAKLVLPKATRARRTTAPASPPALAKGTHQRIPVITEEQAPAVPEDAPLAKKIEGVLRGRVLSYAEIAEEVSEEEARVAGAWRSLQRRGKVANVGTTERPMWVWVMGDGLTTPALRQYVERLVRVRPMSYQEIVTAVGANPNRVKGVLTDLQRRGENPLRNFGTAARAVWFISPKK